KPGTISPAANTWIWNLLSVSSAMRLERYSGLPYSVSSDLGQLAVKRHFTSGIDCAIAGAATADAARPPAPAVLMNFRLDSVVMPFSSVAGPVFGLRRFAYFALIAVAAHGSRRPQALPSRGARHHRRFSPIAKLPLTSICRSVWRSPGWSCPR